MLFAPIAYKTLKISLILLVISCVVISIILRKDGRIPISREVFVLTCFFTGIGLFFTFVGLLRGNYGALAVATVHILWPWLYLIFIAGLNNKNILRNTIRTMVYATLVIEIYTLSYYFYTRGTLPSSLFLDLNIRKNIGFHDGYTEISLDSIGSLVFLLPFVFSALCMWKAEQKLIFNRMVLWINLILGIIVLLLSGRRALILTTALSPIFLLFFAFFLPKIKRKQVVKNCLKLLTVVIIIAIIVFLYLNIVSGFNFNAFKKMFYSAFDFSDVSNESAYVRKTQMAALINGWSHHPILGNGFGAVADVIRSIETPWLYELQYFAYLFQTGIIGIVAYGMGICWIFIHGIKIIKNDSGIAIIMVPMLVGFTCFLIANATNPYLNKYDFLWVIFLPIGFVNFYLTNKNKGNVTNFEV